MIASTGTTEAAPVAATLSHIETTAHELDTPSTEPSQRPLTHESPAPRLSRTASISSLRLVTSHGVPSTWGSGQRLSPPTDQWPAPKVSPQTPVTPHPNGREVAEMSSNGTNSHGSSAVSLLEEAPGGFFPFGEVGEQQEQFVSVLGQSEAILTRAEETLMEVELDVDRLWHASMAADNRALSERLAEISHAVRQAARRLQQKPVIG
jgi:hypothetical protein